MLHFALLIRYVSICTKKSSGKNCRSLNPLGYPIAKSARARYTQVIPTIPAVHSASGRIPSALIPLNMLSLTANKADMVRYCYAGKVRQLYGERLNVPEILEDTRTWFNAVSFYQMVITTGEGLPDIMELGCILWENWALKKFNQKFLPFRIFISDFSREKILKELPKARKSDRIDSSKVAYLLTFLQNFDKKISLSLLNSGVLTGGNLRLKKLLAEEISKL